MVEVAAHSISRCPSKIRVGVAGTVVLCGGNVKMPGFTRRVYVPTVAARAVAPLFALLTCVRPADDVCRSRELRSHVPADYDCEVAAASEYVLVLVDCAPARTGGSPQARACLCLFAQAAAGCVEGRVAAGSVGRVRTAMCDSGAVPRARASLLRQALRADDALRTHARARHYRHASYSRAHALRAST